jgi:molybdopterin-guanine dinucleotide biosynthesis protein A
MFDIPAVIFAGGKSSRMGQDKALLPFANTTSLSQFQYQKLNKLFHTVYLSAKENKFDFSCQVIIDIYKESSPLVGIVSFFESVEAEAVFILSVDAPLVDEIIINKLYEVYRKNIQVSAVIAKSPNGLEPLCGIYTRDILPLAKRYLNTNNHRLTQLLDNSHIKVVAFPNNKPFTNLNTPEEYKAIL